LWPWRPAGVGQPRPELVGLPHGRVISFGPAWSRLPADVDVGDALGGDGHPSGR
jgi:hypothetical protein